MIELEGSAAILQSATDKEGRVAALEQLRAARLRVVLVGGGGANPGLVRAFAEVLELEGIPGN